MGVTCAYSEGNGISGRKSSEICHEFKPTEKVATGSKAHILVPRSIIILYERYELMSTNIVR